ncbi:hypothetical protein [Pseudooceanicola atlanticus]|nr:hypothetical protein [Pseudooceanicola atlanticus]
MNVVGTQLEGTIMGDVWTNHSDGQGGNYTSVGGFCEVTLFGDH